MKELDGGGTKIIWNIQPNIFYIFMTIWNYTLNWCENGHEPSTSTIIWCQFSHWRFVFTWAPGFKRKPWGHYWNTVYMTINIFPCSFLHVSLLRKPWSGCQITIYSTINHSRSFLSASRNYLNTSYRGKSFCRQRERCIIRARALSTCCRWINIGWCSFSCFS